MDVLKTQDAEIKVSRELLEGLENIQAAKIAGKYSDEMLDTIKWLFKFVI